MTLLKGYIFNWGTHGDEVAYPAREGPQGTPCNYPDGGIHGDEVAHPAAGREARERLQRQAPRWEKVYYREGYSSTP